MQITLCYCNNREDKDYQKVLVRNGNINFKERYHFVWTYDTETEILKDNLKRYKGFYKEKALSQIKKVLTLVELFLLHSPVIYDINDKINLSKYPLKLNNFKEPTSFIKKEVILRKRNAHEYYKEKEEVKATINELNLQREEVTT